MHCGHCAEAIAGGLKKIKGVLESEVLYTTGKGRVIFDPEVVKVEDLVKAVKELGYNVKAVKE
jgi:copper chaperone CopZ